MKAWLPNTVSGYWTGSTPFVFRTALGRHGSFQSKQTSDMEVLMKPHPASTENHPSNESGNSNNDGCILVSAGLDDAQDATTNWDQDSDSAGNVQTPEDAHGMPGYSRDSEEKKAHSTPSKRPSKDDAETGAARSEQDNDGVD